MQHLNYDLDTVLGKLHRFWWWCVDFAEDGDLSRHDANRIGRAVGEIGPKCETFLSAMIKAGFIDADPTLRVHDWWDYAGRYLQSKYKSTPKKWKEIKRIYYCVGTTLHGRSNRTHNIHNITEPTGQTKEKRRSTLTDAEFIEALKRNPAYTSIDIDTELAKMDAWLLTPKGHGRKKSRGFIVNWLNKIEKPMDTAADRNPYPLLPARNP